MESTKKFLFLCLGSPFTPTMYYKENYYIKAAVEEKFKVYVIANQQTYIDGKLAKVPAGMDRSFGYQIKRVKLDTVVNGFFTYKIRKYGNLLETIRKMKPDYIYFNTPQIEGVQHCREIKEILPNVKIYLGFSTIYLSSGRNFLSMNILNKMIYRYWLKKSIPYVDKVIYICNECKRYLEDVYHIREKLNFMMLPAMIIAEEERKETGKKIKEKYGIADNEFVFCHSGKMDRQKKSLDLLRLFTNTPNSGFKLIISGSFSDDIEEEAMKIIEADERIIFTSFVPAEELTEILCAADFYIQPGSVSQTVETAICCGCAVVLEDNDINRELCRGNGYLIKDVKELGDILSDISGRRVNIRKLQEHSYELAEKYMDYRIQFRKLADIK